MNTGQLKASFQAIANLPRVRQLGLLLGLVASLALAIYIVLWSQTIGPPSRMIEPSAAVSSVSGTTGRKTLVNQADVPTAMVGDGTAKDTRVSPPPRTKSIPPISFGEDFWIWDIGRQLFGGVIAILVMLGVLRPMMRHLVSSTAVKQTADPVEDDIEQDQVILSDQDAPGFSQADDELNLEFVKVMVSQEPKRVVQVVKQWLNEC